MLAIGFNTGPLVAGLLLVALGLGLLVSKRFRRWGLVALAAFVVPMAAARFSAPSGYEAEVLVSPEAQPVVVVADEGGYRVTVDIGDCLTLYRVDGSEWQPTLFDATPGDKWDGKAEEWCTISLQLDAKVNISRIRSRKDPGASAAAPRVTRLRTRNLPLTTPQGKRITPTA